MYRYFQKLKFWIMSHDIVSVVKLSNQFFLYTTIRIFNGFSRPPRRLNMQSTYKFHLKIHTVLTPAQMQHAS